MYTKYIFVLTGAGELFVLSPTSFPYLQPCKVCHTLDRIKPNDEPDLNPAMIGGGQSLARIKMTICPKARGLDESSCVHSDDYTVNT